MNKLKKERGKRGIKAVVTSVLLLCLCLSSAGCVSNSSKLPDIVFHVGDYQVTVSPISIDDIDELSKLVDDVETSADTVMDWPNITFSVPVEVDAVTVYDYYVKDEYNVGFLGYAVKDINKDDIPELLLIGKDYESNFEIYSLFTLNDNKAVHLHSGYSRGRMRLAADGTIYVVGSSGADRTHLYSYKLKAGATKLTGLTAYESDYIASTNPNTPGTLIFYHYVDGSQMYISEKEFFDLDSMYTKPANPMKLKFIPIEQ